MEIAVLDRTLYRMLGLGTYLVTISQVLHLITYSFQEYSVLSTMHQENNMLLGSLEVLESAGLTGLTRASVKFL
jgi:hypothetical protein